MKYKNFDKLIRPIKISNRIMGIWPLKESAGFAAKLVKSFHLISFTILVVIQATATSVDTFNHRMDLNEATECALITSAFYLSIFRYVAFATHTRDIAYVVNVIKMDWNSLDEDNRSILIEKCYKIYELAKVFIISVVSTALLFSLGPILKNDYSVLPFRGNYFVDYTTSPKYEIMYIINVFIGWCGCNTIASVTSFSFICVMHAATKFSILQKKMQSVQTVNSGTKAIVKNLLKMHQEAIRFAEAVDRIINLVALGQFLISSGLLCCAGFQMTSMIQDKHRLVKYSCFLNSAILEMFLFSYSGQQLIIESQGTRDANYECCWTIMNKSLCKSLFLMMMRSEKYCKISAGKFFIVSLETFATVLRTSFSYFTMLNAFNEDN